MDDREIIALFFARNEMAISESERKYGPYCYEIAYRVTGQEEDAKETVNDTLLAAWDNIPPQHPWSLKAFLGKIARNLSLKRWRYLTAEKRKGDCVSERLEELSECVSDGKNIDDTIQTAELAKRISDFLMRQKERDRNIFVRRYYYFDTIEEISARLGCGESRVKSILFRLRKKLRKVLEEEGYVIE